MACRISFGSKAEKDEFLKWNCPPVRGGEVDYECPECVELAEDEVSTFGKERCLECWATSGVEVVIRE